MTDLRRLAVLVGFATALLQRFVGAAGASQDAVVLVVLLVFAGNEVGRHMLDQADGDGRVLVVANAQVSLDTLALLTLLHAGGGFGSAGVLFLPIPFFVYGAVLSLGHVMAHLAEALLGLSLLGLLEHAGVLAQHTGGALLLPAMAGGGELVVVTIVLVGMVSALGAVTSHFLSSMLQARAADSRVLLAERGTLLAGAEREAGRVQLLLDVARIASTAPSAQELMNGVCRALVASGRFVRVETFEWNAAEGCLVLVVASGGAGQGLEERECRYAGDLPIVSRLRAGEVVDFDVAPSLIMSAARVKRRAQRAFAVPIRSAGGFEGALVLGYDQGSDPAEVLPVVQAVADEVALGLATLRTRAGQDEGAGVADVLLGLTETFGACTDTAELWQRITTTTREVLETPWAVTARFDEREGTFGLVAADGLPDAVVEAFREARVRLEESPALKELLARGELLVADESHVRDVVAASGWQVGAWLVIPLFRGGWVAGVVAAGYVSRRRNFAPRHLRLAEGIGRQAAIALRNAGLVADLEEADRLKSEFVSTMAHELRTPLNIINGYTEMLRDGAVGALTPEQRDLVDRLDARGHEVLELVEATLQVGRLEAGRAVVEIVPVELGELVRTLQAGTAGLPRADGVTLDWEIPAGARVVMTDAAKLALVVRNLVGNALKFTPRGSVRVSLRVRDEALAVEVADTGIGIAAEHLPVIFEMFRQLDGANTRGRSGVGLGLYIVRQFVTRLGGTIEVASTEGRGTRFTAVFPRAAQERRRAA